MFSQARFVGALEPWMPPDGDASNAWGREDEIPGSTRTEQYRRMLAYVPVEPPAKTCTNSTSGEKYSCTTQQYPVLVIIVAGIVSMVFLVTVALVLLMCSFYKRRGSGEQLAAQVVPSSGTAALDATAATTTSDDFILVYMPGDEHAIVARPVPFSKEPYDCKSIGGEREHEEDSSAGIKQKASDEETALPVPHSPSSLPRQGFRLSRHASLRFEHSRIVASRLAEARSSSFPRRQSGTDPPDRDPADSRISSDQEVQEQQESRLPDAMARAEATVEMRSISMSREGSLSFQRLRPSSISPREELLQSRHASMRFERSRSVSSLFEGARSLSFPRREIEAGLRVLDVGMTDGRTSLL